MMGEMAPKWLNDAVFFGAAFPILRPFVPPFPGGAKLKEVKNVHLSNVHFVLRDI